MWRLGRNLFPTVIAIPLFAVDRSTFVTTDDLFISGRSTD
jgi:hypothetical protein